MEFVYGGVFMIKIGNEKGSINVYDEVIARIVGYVTTQCFGVVAMASKRPMDNIVSLLKWDNMDKGVSILSEGNVINIQIHIAVVYGVNIPAITDSIINKVKYTVEKDTGFDVGDVKVFVDTMKVG